MDDLQNFVAAMNLSKFRDQIRTEVDPARRKTLHHADAEHRRLPPDVAQPAGVDRKP